ncbi:hypothetical protein SAY87_024003 [Trapa incisa]|uniref:RRM domain-containing protein n=1 Tax=Trapa incisa TaxID=236973 RepID=A0AAN7QRU0_9MYRT|nr:hypothetical protein SAY87_024003 [Trapa incisa]
MAKKKQNNKGKFSKIPAKKNPVKKVKTKKQPPVPKPDSGSESESDQLSGLLEPYTKDQLVSLIVDSAVNNPSLYGYIREVADRDVTHRKIFVHGLGRDIKRQTLVSAFEAFGEIEECNVVMDRVTGNTKGYGFVLFKTRKGASKALREPQKRVGNRIASCQLASLGSVAKDPNSGSVAASKKNGGLVDHKINNQGQTVLAHRYGQQGPEQPLQPEVLAAVAAAQNLNMLAQHPGLHPMYSGLLVNTTPAGSISPAIAGSLSNSFLGLGRNGFGQGMLAKSQLSSGTSGGSVLGPYGTYESPISATPLKVQVEAPQIGHSFLSSRNKGAASGSFSGYTSYLWL